MLKPLFLLIVFSFLLHSVQAQKKYIKRKVAQKNYEGYILMKEHKYDSALVFFNQAITDDPQAFFIYQNRAICKMHLKDTIGAIADYKSNIKLEPDNAESKYALGNIYKTKKDTLNAIKYFIPAIDQASEEFSQKKLLYMNNFAGHYFKLNEQYDSALVFYKRVKIYTPQNASVFINLAVCHFGLDSLKQFCSDLEQAFILGGNVNCIALKSYCKGCNHLLEERGKTDTLSTALDTRLAGIISDTIFYKAFRKPGVVMNSIESSKKVKVYFNEHWQISLPEKASFYREAFWSSHSNFFGGDFIDYYIDGKVYAKGRIEKTKPSGVYKSYYPNGNVKVAGEFANEQPCKKWTFFLEDGTPDYEVEFFFDNFELQILNQKNPNYQINNGSGKFEILFDKWDKIKFELKGEFLDNKREGQWTYLQHGKKVISENYKKGKFKRGYFISNVGNISHKSTMIDASLFIPPQFNQVRSLFFDSIEASQYYPFIKISSF